MACSHLVALFVTTAGQNGESLGSDEEQIVSFVYLLYDVTNNKVGKKFRYVKLRCDGHRVRALLPWAWRASETEPDVYKYMLSTT